ncbi:hypothetical protein SCATT_53890 [Streptantibioticus cattleyicolor NRRL 8057 = DSM 46488]|uniref:Uncharacterized protein n=1 Tax=Streptantibioticus cattleyicolor (strain ATCC 35852 / DSM 46488 / JCM 4925 / NBRC 14057 / NRRL 8057) TaxID=1003195 RepID=G8WVK1_STREN|nr:hypothetical protein SCATT_53890 [Streptantibioticus cattleyicolor NRRL 8057 = DSM 46488]
MAFYRVRTLVRHGGVPPWSGGRRRAPRGGRRRRDGCCS